MWVAINLTVEISSSRELLEGKEISMSMISSGITCLTFLHEDLRASSSAHIGKAALKLMAIWRVPVASSLPPNWHLLLIPHFVVFHPLESNEYAPIVIHIELGFSDFLIDLVHSLREGQVLIWKLVHCITFFSAKCMPRWKCTCAGKPRESVTVRISYRTWVEVKDVFVQMSFQVEFSVKCEKRQCGLFLERVCFAQLCFLKLFGLLANLS